MNNKMPNHIQGANGGNIEARGEDRDVVVQEEKPTSLASSSQPDIDTIEQQIDSLNLTLLDLELPDPAQQIVEQNLGQALDQFKFFPKLPAEIRLMVWKFKFPGRRVVELSCALPAAFYVTCSRGPSKGYSHPPITLFINRESRCLTLECYGVFVDKSYRRVFAVNPCLDLVTVHLWETWGFRMEYLPANAEIIHKIRYLEIRGVEKESMDSIFREVTHHGDHIKWRKFFGMFEGLREIHFVADSLEYMFLETHKEFFDMVADFGNDRVCGEFQGTPFQIILHDFRRRQSRSDHDYLHEAAIPYPWNGRMPSSLESSTN